jgi:hypothetical protein
VIQKREQQLKAAVNLNIGSETAELGILKAIQIAAEQRSDTLIGSGQLRPL